MSVAIQERVQNLEELMADLIKQTNRTTFAVERLSQEMSVFKSQMLEFKNEMKEFKNEMLEFKNEMKEFKNEMLEFKNEMKEFKNEMLEFKNEMNDFKNEMNDFKSRQEEENKRKNKEWSNLAKKMGTIVEDLIAPALRPVLTKYFKCSLTLEGQRIRRRLKGKEYEVDAIAVSDKKVFMIEAKSTPRISDVKDILEKSRSFFEFFNEYKGKELVIIFGGITFEEPVIKEATNSGLYVLGWREWEYMDILNYEAVFQHKKGS